MWIGRNQKRSNATQNSWLQNVALSRWNVDSEDVIAKISKPCLKRRRRRRGKWWWRRWREQQQYKGTYEAYPSADFLITLTAIQEI